MALVIPEGYKPVLSGRRTERAIKFARDTFQHEIVTALNLAFCF